MHNPPDTGNRWITGARIDAYAWSERAAGRAPKTVRLRVHYLRRMQSIRSLDDADVFLSNPGWKPNTRRSAAAALRSWLRWAARSGLQMPPADLVRMPKALAGVPRPAADDDIGAAVAAAPARTRLILLLAAEMGLRREEIARLDRGDVVAGHLIVRGKGGRERIVPCPLDLATILLPLPEGPVFPGRCGGHLSADRVGRIGSAALPPGVTLHKLRHRFATAAYRAEGDILSVQRLLGHASVATTMVYAAPADGAMRRAVAAAHVRRLAP